MVICALPALVALAMLDAVRVTVLGCGWLDGARKSTSVSLPVGGVQGFDEGAQISPTVELPSTTPFTAQVTARFVVPVTMAAKLTRCPKETDAEGGETVTTIGGGATIVTAAEADCPLETA